jgi:putative endonuclease
MEAYVYILRCADGSFYIGSTRVGLEHRVAEHNAGSYGGYTKSRQPVKLAWSAHFPNVTDAIAAERQLKGWSRAKKDALIRGDIDLLKLLSRNRTGLPAPSSDPD